MVATVAARTCGVLRLEPSIPTGPVPVRCDEPATGEAMERIDQRSCDLLLTGGTVLTVDDDRNVFEPLFIPANQFAVGRIEQQLNALATALRSLDSTARAHPELQ